MNFFKHARFWVSAVLALTVVACAGTSESEILVRPLPDYEIRSAPHVINIGTQPLYVPTGLITSTLSRDAVLQEDLRKLAMEIEFFPFLKGQDVNAFLATGDLDAGVGGDMPALVASVEQGVTVVAQLQSGLISIISDGLLLVSDLRGKSIGYAPGSNAHFMLLNALSVAGLDLDDVRLVPMDAPAMPDALASGVVSAVAGWEPFVDAAWRASPSRQRLYRSMSSGYLYFSDRFAQANPDAMLAIVAATERTVDWLARSRTNLLTAARWAIDDADVLQVAIELTPEQLADLAAADLFSRPATASIPEISLAEGGRLYREFEFLREFGALPAVANWEQARAQFDTDIGRRVSILVSE